MAKTGRKPLYDEWLTPDGLLLIKGWIREGRTEEDIARNEMHIHPATLCEWKNKFPELNKAVKKTKAIQNAEIDDAFYRDLQGHYVEEETSEVIIIRDADNNIIRKTEHKRKNKRYIPASAVERIFYYKVQRHWNENQPDTDAMNIEDDPLTKSLKEYADGLEGGEDNADK
jgi:hypothetical protein